MTCNNCKDYQSQIGQLKQIINKRNRHIAALKETNAKLQIIRDAKQLTSGIFNEGSEI